MTTCSPIERSGPDADLLQTKDFICSLCGFKFSQQECLTKHFDLCKGIENPSDRFCIETVIVKHERYDEENCTQELLESHNDIKPTFDIKTEEMVFTEYTISGSSPSPRTTPREPFESNDYDYTAAQFTQLEQHMKIHKDKHKEEKVFKCMVCDYTCTRESHLTLHMRKHTGEKPFQCTVCHYACALRPNLIRHMMTHTGEKPFKCTICDHASAFNGDLKKHMRKHTGEKPFKCTICDYACNQESNLTRHMRSHTGERPFKCTICDYACTDESNLAKHLRKHTGEKPF